MPYRQLHLSTRVHKAVSALSLYTSRRMLAVFFMGFSSGLPLLLGYSTLSYWLKEESISLTNIGLFALISIPYAYKALWAPFIDKLRLPLFTPALGQRRGWLLFIQILLALSIMVVGQADPRTSMALLSIFAVTMAFLSASQDIVVDAYRIEILGPDEQGGGAAATQLGYRIGMLASGAGALALSDHMNWSEVYIIMGALIAVGILATLFAPRPPKDREILGDIKEKTPYLSPLTKDEVPLSKSQRKDKRLSAWVDFFKSGFISPLVEFAQRPRWYLILIFIVLYKVGDSIGAGMLNPFLQDLSFSGTEIAEVVKAFGILPTMIGVFAGGLAVARLGLFNALVVGGVLQAITNVLFAVQANLGHDMSFLYLVIGMDNFTGGLGSAAFVAYLSRLCHVSFTATQYALLTSFMAQSRTLFTANSGWIAEVLGWGGFFVSTAMVAVPGLILLVFIRKSMQEHRQGDGVIEVAPQPITY